MKDGSKLQEIRFLNSGDGVKQLLDAVKPKGDLEAVTEATCNAWVKIHDTLECRGILVKLVKPSKTKAGAKRTARVMRGLVD